MYFVPFALLVAAFDPGFLVTHGLDGTTLMWSRFFIDTLGNVIGGTVLVGGVYWFGYLRARPAVAVGARPRAQKAR